jgi:hypothetical protein
MYWMIQKPVTKDKVVTGSKTIICYFRFFWKIYDNVKGISGENVKKKIKNKLTLLYNHKNFSDILNR